MQITPLSVGFGAKITGFDLANNREPGAIAQLQSAYKAHDLLIFSSAAPLSPALQVEITGWFGPVLIESGAGWSVLDNAEPAGRFRLPFHSDTTFLEHPLAGLSLYPQSLPSKPTSTSFVSAASAWRELPEALRRALQDKKARHYHAHKAIDLGRPYFEHWHPVCMPHPVTGIPLLFVSKNHVSMIEGLSEQRSAEILQTLFASLYAPERQYEHVWREGDLLVWNNFAIQHARTQTADISHGPRIMRRVQLGEISFAAQVERLRQEFAT